jgi:hypothetical protein
MKRVAKYALLILAAALVGFPIGFWHAENSVGVGAAILSQAIALSEYETLANMQYKQADSFHGAQAQLDLLSFMEQLRTKQKIALPMELDHDQAKAFMRLALLDEQAGDNQGFQQNLHQAQELLNRSDQRWYREETMRTFIAKADSQSQY